YPDAAQDEPARLFDQCRKRPFVNNRGSTGQKDERDHGGNVMAEPEAVRRVDYVGGEVPCRGGRLYRCRKKRVDSLEDPVEQLARIIAVLQKAVEDESKARVELGPVDLTTKQEVPHHEMRHGNECCGRRRECRETLERRMAFASAPQDLVVKVLLARKVPEQERLGNAGRLGELFRGGTGEALARKERHRRCDDRLAAFVAV